MPPKPSYPVFTESVNGIPTLVRVCFTCKVKKPITEYNKASGVSRLGVRVRQPRVWSNCKQCNRECRKKWVKDNPDYHRGYVGRVQKSHRKDNPAYARLKDSRSHARKGGYKPCNVSAEWLESVWRTVCDGCGREMGDKIRIDHCHDTGKFRGFLCGNCNLILGLSRDDPKVLERLTSYLKSGGSEGVS